MGKKLPPGIVREINNAKETVRIIQHKKAKKMEEIKDGTSIAKKTKEAKTIELPSGSVAVINPFKFKTLQEAQRLIGDNSERLMAALIALTTTIDGNDVVMEDIEEMDGIDAIALLGEFSDFTGFSKLNK